MTTAYDKTVPAVQITAWEQVFRNKDKLWYLACAYTGKTKIEVEENIHESLVIASLLTKEGLHIHHPTYFTHKMAQINDLPTDHQYWWQHNIFFMDASFGALVVRRNYKTSRGVTAELDYLQQKWKPSFLVDRMGTNLVVRDIWEE